jgi:hypothetical protein
MQSVNITTNVVSLHPVHGEVYSIQHYVIKFVSDLWQIGDFLRVLDNEYYVSVRKSNIFVSKTVFYDILVFSHICILISIDKQIKIQHLQLINWLHGFFDQFTNFAECFFFIFFIRSWRGVLDTTLCDKVCQ